MSPCFPSQPHGSCGEALNLIESTKKYGNYNAPDSHADLTMRYPPNRRCYNCKDDENDEIAYEESDIYAYEDDESDDWNGSDGDGGEDNDEVEAYNKNKRQRELSETSYSLVAEEKIESQLPLARNDIELKSNLRRRDRCINMHSVSSPVENLTQWRKAIKASTHMHSVRNPVENLTQLRNAIKASTYMHSVRSPVENFTQLRKAIKASTYMHSVRNPVENLTQLRNAIKASTYMHSVRCPVENLTQWKAIKAKVTSSKHIGKEDVPLEQKTGKPFVSETSDLSA